MVRIVWLKPKKPPNISGGRYKIGDGLREKGYDVEFFEVSGSAFFKTFFKLLFKKYDILIGTVRTGLLLSYILSKVKRKKYIADITESFSQYEKHANKTLAKIIKHVEFSAIKKATRATFVQEDYLEEMKNYGVDGIRVTNWVEYDKISSPSQEIIDKTQEILIDNGVDLEKNIVLYTGSLSKVYNLDKVIETARNFQKAEFILIGDGEERQKLLDLSKGLKNIHFLGIQPHHLIPGFLYHSDVCLSLVNVEHPVKMLEYGAAGKPTITLKGDPQKKFSDNEAFFIENSEEDLKRALKRLLTDRELRRSLGENLRKEVKKYDLVNVINKYEEIIRDALETGD